MNTAINTTNSTNTAKTGVSELEQLGEKLGVFYPYDSLNTPAELLESRIVKIIIRNKKKGNSNETDTSGSKYVRIPNNYITKESISKKLEVLMPHIEEWLLGIEDSMIREGYKKGLTSIATEYLSLEKVIEHLEVNSTASRLNGELIETFFAEYINDYLCVAFAEKLGASVDSIEVSTIVNAYKDKFASLASPKVMLVDSDRESIAKVLDLAGASESIVGKKLLARLESMKNKSVDLLASL